MLQGGGAVTPPKPVTAIRRCLFLSHFTRAGRTVQLLWFWPEQFFSIKVHFYKKQIMNKSASVIIGLLGLLY